MKKVIVITGIGGMGLATARRIGTGFKLLVCDFNQKNLDSASNELINAGYDVEAMRMDVSDQDSVERTAIRASELGELHAIIHTAGLSPTMSSAEHILEVDLLGTARMLYTFEKYLAVGTVGIFIASMAAYFSELDSVLEKELASMGPEDLKEAVAALGITDVSAAYSISKKINQLQVRAAAVKWGKLGARVMSISPGIIQTPMSIKEQGEGTTDMKSMLEHSPIQRLGTPEDIAGVVEFLISPAAGFLTGSDILVDGGVIAMTSSIQ